VWRSLVAQLLWEQWVARSNRVTPTNSINEIRRILEVDSRISAIHLWSGERPVTVGHGQGAGALPACADLHSHRRIGPCRQSVRVLGDEPAQRLGGPAGLVWGQYRGEGLHGR
jgi:hypothetical protein